MKSEEEIKAKIEELNKKRFNDKDEYERLRIKDGHLNSDRMVEFGMTGCIDIPMEGRFQIIKDILEWVLEDD